MSKKNTEISHEGQKLPLHVIKRMSQINHVSPAAQSNKELKY